MAGIWAKKVCGKPTKSSPGFHAQVLLLRALSPAGNSFTSLVGLPVRNKDAECKRKLDPQVQNSPSLGGRMEGSRRALESLSCDLPFPLRKYPNIPWVSIDPASSLGVGVN